MAVAVGASVAVCAGGRVFAASGIVGVLVEASVTVVSGAQPVNRIKLMGSSRCKGYLIRDQLLLEAAIARVLGAIRHQV